MLIVKPQVILQSMVFDPPFLVSTLARYARECYQSENIDDIQAQEKFVARLIRSGHESTLEHEKITMHLTCDRGVSHELVRHRIASYSQESTRYVDYAKRGGAAFIAPVGFKNWPARAQYTWMGVQTASENAYFDLRDMGIAPQDARDALTNAFRTRVVATFNIRSLRNMLKLRCDKAAHPKYRQLAIPLPKTLQEYTSTSALVRDILYDEDFPQDEYADVLFSDAFFNVPGVGGNE